jgi:hypothetical protein
MKTATRPSIPYTATIRRRSHPVCLSSIESTILVNMLKDRRAFSTMPERMPNVHPELQRLRAYTFRLQAARYGCVRIDLAAWFGRTTPRQERAIFAALNRLEAVGLVKRLTNDRPDDPLRVHVDAYRRLTDDGQEHALAEIAFEEFRAKSRQNFPPAGEQPSAS